MRLFDSHAHLLDSRLADGAIRSQLLRRARSASVEAVLVPAVSPQDWHAENIRFHAFPQPDLSPALYFALGLHPHALPGLDPEEDDDLMERLERRILERNRAVVAVGECGLDYGLSVCRARQQRLLISQIQLASRAGLPLILHCVRAHDDLLRLLDRHGAPVSVLHGFTGSPETAARWTSAGHYIGLGGLLTRPGARRVRAAAATIDRRHLLVETDAPDQTPHGRGRVRNEPSFIIDVVQSVAQLRGESVEAIADLTWENATRLFRTAS